MASSSNSHGSRKKKSSSVNKANESLTTLNKSTSPLPSSNGRSSPDQTCSICLGQHENKCFTNKCLHEFCFSCLLEWSKVNTLNEYPLVYILSSVSWFVSVKVKAECPLCKQQFTSIIHNIRPDQQYDEHQIPVMQPQEPNISLSTFDLLMAHPRFRFRYKTSDNLLLILI